MESQVIQDLMAFLVHQGLKGALELQAREEYQDLLGILESKGFLAPGDILAILVTR